jgi:MoaA/NifB/PqqE/SkfB family radical SAM enzyme
VDAARNQGYKRIKVTTNARALADFPAAIKMVETGCYFFEIKIPHYRPDIHDNVTQAKGSFKEAVQGLVNLRSINTLHQAPFSAFISLRVSLSSKNYEECGSIILSFIPYKIDRFILSFDDSSLELAKALPYIKNAIDLSILNRIWITTQNLPLCTMTGYEHHVSELYHSPEGDFKKSETCKECRFDEFCPGLNSDYADTLGFNDLKPFRENNPMIEDFRNLTHAAV